MRSRSVASLVACLALLAGACSDGGDGENPFAADEETTTTEEETTTTTEADDGAEAGGDTADPLGGFEPEPLQWDGCGGGMECANLTVPLDWSDPSGATIDLAVTRLPADGDNPIGAIATNPGGPGGSGNDFIRGGGVFDSALTERFDTLSWDPRGVGGSAPLSCDGEEVEEFVRLDSDPDSPEEQAQLDEGAQAVAAACEAASGERLPFVGTGSTARDLEAIRRAYGAPMAYFGFSYGTAIGLHHLELFPGTMLGVVLDGVVDPTHSQTDLLRSQTVAFEEVLTGVLDGCPDSNRGCPAGGAAAAYDELAAQVETAPLPAGGDDLGPADLATAAIFAAYDEGSHDALYQGLVDAQAGDGSTLLALAERYRSASGFDLYQAVSCVDSANPTGSEAWSAFAAELEAISSRFGAAVANEMRPCAFWPADPVVVNGPIVAEGSGPVLVIGTTGDPATPVAQAERVADTLADGHLIVFDGEGHTAYFTSGCVRDAVTAYLLDGEVPADGTRC